MMAQVATVPTTHLGDLGPTAFNAVIVRVNQQMELCLFLSLPICLSNK